MTDTSKVIYEKAKMLSSFLEDDDDELIASIQEELLKFNISHLPILKELKQDLTNAKAIKHLSHIIVLKEREEIADKLINWAQNPQSLIEAFDLLAQLEPDNNSTFNFAFEIFLLGKEAFLKTPFESSSVIEVLEALHSTIIDFSESNNYTDNRVYKFFAHTLPENTANSIYIALIYKYIGDTFDYPIHFLPTDEGFVMGFKNEGAYKIEFIDDPYLVIFKPEKNNFLRCVPPQTAINDNIVTDFDAVENVDFLIMTAAMIEKTYSRWNDNEKATWINNLIERLKS